MIERKRNVAERKSLSASVDTSDDYVPDFREVIAYKKSLASQASTNGDREQGRLVNSEEEVRILVNLEKFRKILADLSLDTLLLVFSQA